MAATQKKLCGTKEWAKEASGFPHDLSDEQKTVSALQGSLTPAGPWRRVGLAAERHAARVQVLAEFKPKATEEVLDAIKYSCETTDDVACRYLRARQFDVAKATEMAQNCKISTSFAISRISLSSNVQIKAF